MSLRAEVDRITVALEAAVRGETPNIRAPKTDTGHRLMLAAVAVLSRWGMDRQALDISRSLADALRADNERLRVMIGRGVP